MTKGQAERLAKQIFEEFDKQIVEACAGTNIPPRFIAGLIGNEAGKDRQGNIRRSATRFEPGVYRHLVAVRDGKEKSYSGIKRVDIAEASNAALQALATSYEATQIMGWHCIHNFHCTINDLRNPDKHFFYTVKLLQLNGFPPNASDERMADEMRQWNTGREKGKTYHENYVPNAKAVRDAYSILEKGRRSRTVEERVYNPEDNYMNPNQEPEGRGDDTTFDFTDDDVNGLVDNIGSDPTTNVVGNDAGNPEELPVASPDQPATQLAENITNVNSGDKNVPDNFVAEDKVVEAPPPSGILGKAKVWLATLGLGIPGVGGILEAAKTAYADGRINLNDVFQVGKEIFATILPYAAGIAVLFLLFWGVKELLKQVSFMITQYTLARGDMHNVRVETPSQKYVAGQWRFAPTLFQRPAPPSITESKGD